MDANSTVIADDKEQLKVEETDDSSGVDFIEIVPLCGDTDGSCTTECVSGDWSAEVKQENPTVVKQEPDDVCCVIYFTYLLPAALTASCSTKITWGGILRFLPRRSDTLHQWG